MSKKLSRYRGYILLESIIALGLMCLITGSYFSLNIFLLEKNKEASNQLNLHRVLYEEMKYYENHGGALNKKVYVNNKDHQLHFYKDGNMLTEVGITNESEQFTIKKE